MVTACGPKDTRDADIKALRDTETKWNQAFAAKDPTKIASFYAAGAVLMVPGQAPVSGSDALLDAEKQMTADPALALSFQADKVDVAQSGDLGYTRGSYTLTMTNPQTKKPMDDHGSYVTVYRKQADGSWKAVSDIVVSAVPPMPAKPAAHAKEHRAKPAAHRRKKR
jgi:uncharacterized protein (TIGR02246 family)